MFKPQGALKEAVTELKGLWGVFFLLPDQGTELSPELFAPARRLRHLTGSRFLMQGAGQSHRNRHRFRVWAVLRAGVDVLVHELNGFNLLGSNSHFCVVFQSLFLLAVQREAQKAAQRHLSLRRAMSGLLKHGQGHHPNLPPFPKNPRAQPMPHGT